MAAVYAPSVIFAGLGAAAFYAPRPITQIVFGLLTLRNLVLLRNPLGMAANFGIKDPDERSVTFVPTLIGRNLSLAAMIFALIQLGESRAVGVVLLCLPFAGLGDVYVASGSPRWVNHLVATVVIVAMSIPWLQGRV